MSQVESTYPRAWHLMWIDDEHVTSYEVDGTTHVWRVPRLWDLAEGLPVVDVPVAELEHLLDEVVWFHHGGGDDRPTVRAVAEHGERISSADLSYPIIRASEGWVMDGLHRLARAWVEGQETIRVARFVTDPEPDWVEANGGE